MLVWQKKYGHILGRLPFQTGGCWVWLVNPIQMTVLLVWRGKLSNLSSDVQALLICHTLSEEPRRERIVSPERKCWFTLTPKSVIVHKGVNSEATAKITADRGGWPKAKLRR